MKITLSLLTVLVCATLAQQSHAAEFLNASQKKEILSEIDSVCADTWCEGDYGYAFNAITCSSVKKECSVQFNMIEGAGAPATFKQVAKNTGFVAKISTSHSVACTVKGLSKIEDLYTVEGTFRSLNEQFYTNLTDCIGSLEKQLR